MKESKVNDFSYYQISGWMLNKLNLKGTALQIYAIIYGFSQDGETEFKGSLQYLCDFTGASKPTVISALKKLVAEDLIIKNTEIINGVAFNRYRANLQVVKNLYGGSKDFLLNNISNNIENNKNSSNTTTIYKNSELENSNPDEFFKTPAKTKEPLVKSNNRFQACKNHIYNFTKNEELQNCLIQFLNCLLEIYRSEGKSLYANMFKGKLNALKDLTTDENEMIKIVKKSIESGWKGFYALTENTYSKKTPDKFSEGGGLSCEQMTPEEKAAHQKWIEDMEAQGKQVAF